MNCPNGNAPGGTEASEVHGKASKSNSRRDKWIEQLGRHIAVYEDALARFAAPPGIAHSVARDARLTLAILTGEAPPSAATNLTHRTARGAMDEIRSELTILLGNRPDRLRLGFNVNRREAVRLLEAGDTE
jgi:hypothetical protein